MSKSNSNSAKGNDPFVMFIENLFQTIFRGGLVTIQGLFALFKLLPEKPIPILSSAIAWGTASFYAGKELYHLRFLHWIWPDLFSGWVMRWFLSFSYGAHMLFLFLSVVVVASFVMGLRTRRSGTRIKHQFESIGLVDSFGKTPKLVRSEKIDEHRERLVFSAKSFGREKFESKRSQLEAIFQKRISSIKSERNPSYIEVMLNSKVLPNRLLLKDLDPGFPLGWDQFFVGESENDAVRADMTELPHLLIAGTTGGGKSVFFRQVLKSLLVHTDAQYQMYLIDLKGGLEFADFKEAPNVRVVKNVEDAVNILELVDAEMKARFAYLEKNGYRSIEIHRDQKTAILVAIDEASVLYGKRSNYDGNEDLYQRARELTDSIAKLGRAARIHLILATQKVSKETIDTTIQENISARMCFQVNTLHGSLAVLGSKDAMDLPNIPGRGIWLNGNEQITVQTPYISSEEIRAFCKKIKADDERNLRGSYEPMLDERKPRHGLKSMLEKNVISISKGDLDA